MRITAHFPTSPQAVRRRRSTRAVVAAGLALATALALAPGADADDTPTDPGPTQPPGATVFQVATFNLLGAGHTSPNGNKAGRGWESGAERMGRAVQVVDQGGFDVVGFQELEPPQLKVWQAQRGGEFGIFPGDTMPKPAMANSIAWRLSEWSLVSTTTIKVPYFHGTLLRKPLILLQNVHTGQQAYFFNTHNPANARGPAAKWRKRAVAIEADMVNDLQAEHPEIPVFVTGDMNDRQKFFCPMTAKTTLVSANGGYNVDGVCKPPTPTKIDWVMATPQVTFTGYRQRQDAFVRRTTDHPVVSATASIPPLAAQGTGIRRVLMLDVEGLRTKALTKLGATGAPNLYRMMAEGSSTLDARTEVERTTLLPNVVGMLTGRRVDPALDGHGVTAAGDDGSTVAAHAGRYVSSVFDLAHNLGEKTALLSSKPDLALVQRSWDDAHGGRDPYGVDDGRDKITKVVTTPDDHRLVGRLVKMLHHKPKAFTLAHVSALADSGRRDGWMKPAYLRTLSDVDTMVGTLLDTISADPQLASETLVLLTSDGGGRKHSKADPTRPANYRVPVMAWGSHVAAGTDLYAINPAYTHPGKARVAYDDPARPIRTAGLANLVTAVLGLPALPGSEMNNDQTLNVFVDPTQPTEPTP